MTLKLLLTIVAVFQGLGRCSSSTCSSRSFYVKDGLKTRALETRIFNTSTINNYHAECFRSCSANCRCLSFNVCGKQCQLSTDTKEMAANSLKIKSGCSYYDFPQVQNTSFPRCCLMSNPCLNGGTCSSARKKNSRFSCVCRPGFHGNICETRNPKSCADFMAESIKPLSGEYTILDDSGNPFQVYCDFDSEPNFAWTLVLSYNREHTFSVIQDKGLLEDSPVNEDDLNWVNYRLSLSRITPIRKRSTHWRATCAFDESGVYYPEYIRVNMSIVDFSVYPSATCQTIEYMNILGSECRNCNFGLYMLSDTLPFLNPQHAQTYHHCTLDLSHKVHNCGTYSTLFRYSSTGCYDPRSKCQMTVSSTIQNWFGKASTPGN